MLEKNIWKKKETKPILLMTHIVLGYPSFEENWKQIEIMAANNVDIIEMQIPFSEPTADGPRIAKANHQSIAAGFQLGQAFDFAQNAANKWPQIDFLFMTYYNIVYSYGIKNFFQQCANLSIKGCIAPDIPPQEAADYKSAAHENNIAPIFIFTPTSTPARLEEIARHCSGFVYGVGRKGVTGIKTQINENLQNTIHQYRQATNLPLALGFGLQNKEDIDFLSGKVDIAVFGSKLLQVYEETGLHGLDDFFKSLNEPMST